MIRQVADAQHLWSSCQEALREQVSDAVWSSTFQDAVAIDLDSDGLLVAVPSAVVKERVENRYLSLVNDVLLDLGGPEAGVRIVVRTAAADPTDVPDPLDALLGPAPATPTPNGSVARPAARPDLADVNNKR